MIFYAPSISSFFLVLMRRSASGGRRHDACDDEDDGGRRIIPIDDRARGWGGGNPTLAREGWGGAGGRSTARQSRREDR